jgi:hypothetical protein
VLVLSTGFETRCVRWLVNRGPTHDQLAPGWNMVTSSLWRSAEVAAWRASAFDRWQAAGAPHRSALPEFNLLTDPAAPHHSPFMTRPLSATRSITQIVVERRQQRAVMRYWRRRADSMIDPERPDATCELPLGFT